MEQSKAEAWKKFWDETLTFLPAVMSDGTEKLLKDSMKIAFEHGYEEGWSNGQIEAS